MNRVTLKTAGLVFLVVWAVHTADHARRGVDASSDAVVWIGTLGGLLSAVVLTLVFTRHRLAPIAAAGAGFALAAGFIAVHLLPHWSVLSDSLPDGDVDGFTWLAVLCEIAGALLLGATALRIVRREGSAASTMSWT
jgi:uncharacterized membrane protein